MSRITLEEAWQHVSQLMEGAALFGRTKFRGSGEVIGWWPSKPGHAALDDDFRTAWLRHEVFKPLKPRELRKLEKEVGRPLPPVLRSFYAKCSNGLAFASGDLAIFGFRRGTEHDPWELFIETVERPGNAESEHFFFGSWGGERHRIYLDERDGSVHVSSRASVRPLRTWTSFEEFLVEASEEHLASFDHEGRRVSEAELPAEPLPATPPKQPGPLTVRADLEHQAERVRRLLKDSPRTLAIGDSSFEIADPRVLGDLQVGYGISPEGADLTNGEGGWSSEWLLIGTEEHLGDPLFVDLASSDLEVLTAEHGAGTWEPVRIASSLSSLLGSA